MLQAIHIRKQFQRSGEVLRDVSFTLGDGEFLSVIGPSGAGKTTLFRILNGTELCSGGEVLYGGTHFEAARGREKRALQQGHPAALARRAVHRYPGRRQRVDLFGNAHRADLRSDARTDLAGKGNS